MLRTIQGPVLVAFILITTDQITAQEVEAKNAQKYVLSARVQLQHLFDLDRRADDVETNNGFRVRRGRFEVKAQVTDWVSAKFQIEARDNSPQINDAEGTIKISDNHYVRFGQFKVPFWREEFIRSSSSLLLIERSAVAAFLEANNFSSWHVGVEFGGKYDKRFSYTVNYSNGAGKGVRETAGTTKTPGINNGKMWIGRLDVPFGEKLEVGISGVSNWMGYEADTIDTKGVQYAVAPDFSLKLGSPKSEILIEGGAAVGSINKKILGAARNQKFNLFDLSARLKQKMRTVSNFGGMDAYEVGAGFTYLEPDTEVKNDRTLIYRAGPAVYFGSKTRVQLNAELHKPQSGDGVWMIRSQATFNF